MYWTLKIEIDKLDLINTHACTHANMHHANPNKPYFIASILLPLFSFSFSFSPLLVVGTNKPESRLCFETNKILSYILLPCLQVPPTHLEMCIFWKHSKPFLRIVERLVRICATFIYACNTYAKSFSLGDIYLSATQYFCEQLKTVTSNNEQRKNWGAIYEIDFFNLQATKFFCQADSTSSNNTRTLF